MRCAVHVEAMKMQARRLVTKLVDHVDYESISDIGIYLRERPFSVDTDSKAIQSTIWIGSYPTNNEIISDCSSFDAAQYYCYKGNPQSQDCHIYRPDQCNIDESQVLIRKVRKP